MNKSASERLYELKTLSKMAIEKKVKFFIRDSQREELMLRVIKV